MLVAERTVADDIRLVQPQLPEVIGKRAFRERFARPLFELLWDILGAVIRSPRSWPTFVRARLRQ